MSHCRDLPIFRHQIPFFKSSNDNFGFNQFGYKETTRSYRMRLSECIYFSSITFEVQLNLMASIIVFDVLCPMNLNQCQHNTNAQLSNGLENVTKWTMMKRALLQFHKEREGKSNNPNK